MLPISVCIIAKNEEQRIEKCLASVKPYGFEIVVVDTGSTDRTKEIAARYADKVLDFVWCDDFSAARNYSLREASNNWIFMLDCDEWIKQIDVEELNYFRKKYPDSVGAVSRENLVTENGQLVLNNTDNTERFFNKKLYRYKGTIHEQLVPVHGTDFPCLLLHTVIEHTGYDMTPEQRMAKGRRNLTLLHKQLEQEPDNPYVYYQLGKGYEIVEDYPAACGYYAKGLSYDLDPTLAYVQAMVVSYGNMLLLTGRPGEALGNEQIYDNFDDTADFVYLMGRIYAANGMYPQAIEQFHKATGLTICRRNGANSFLCYYEIGLICEQSGDTDNALTFYRQCGDFPPARKRTEELLHRLQTPAAPDTPETPKASDTPAASDTSEASDAPAAPNTSETTKAPAAARGAKRLVLFGSDIFILQYIMEQYRRAFEEMGYETHVFPPASSAETFQAAAEQLFLFHEKGIDAVITFNNRGFCMPMSGQGSLWDLWNVPCYNVLVDHPMYYFDTLDQSPARGVVVCADRCHVKYTQRFYPTVRRVVFVPAGGEELHPGAPAKPVAKRAIDVLMIGSYKYHQDYVYDGADEEIMDDLILHPDKTLEQAVEEYTVRSGQRMTDAALKDLIQRHRFVETNLCAMYRLELLRALADTGITVTVYGDGWEQTDLAQHSCCSLHPRTAFRDALALMGDSRIVLNQMAWFKDGGSERVFNAMLQGAVCVTDTSGYLQEHFRDGEDIVFYSLAAPDGLPGLVRELLQDEARMQRIADNGCRRAKAAHTWAHRAAELEALWTN